MGDRYCSSSMESEEKCQHFYDGKCKFQAYCNHQRIHPEIPSTYEMQEMLEKQIINKLMNMTSDQFFRYWMDILSTYIKHKSEASSNAQACLTTIFDEILGTDHYIVDSVSGNQANEILTHEVLNKCKKYSKEKRKGFKCPACNGSGTVKESVPSYNKKHDAVELDMQCKVCNGSGTIIA